MATKLHPVGSWISYDSRLAMIRTLSPDTQILYAIECARRHHLDMHRERTRAFFNGIVDFVLNSDPAHIISFSSLRDQASCVSFPLLELSDDGSLTLDQGTALIHLLIHRQSAAITKDPTRREGEHRDLASIASLTAWASISRAYQNSPKPFQISRETHAIFSQLRGPNQPLDPSLRTSDTTALAKQVLDTQELGIIPILADALEEAGCNDDRLLYQLRHEPLGHTPTMWVIRQLTQPQ